MSSTRVARNSAFGGEVCRYDVGCGADVEQDYPSVNVTLDGQRIDCQRFGYRLQYDVDHPLCRRYASTTSLASFVNASKRARSCSRLAWRTSPQYESSSLRPGSGLPAATSNHDHGLLCRCKLATAASEKPLGYPAWSNSPCWLPRAISTNAACSSSRRACACTVLRSIRSSWATCSW